MLNTDPAALLDEIRAAEEMRKRVLVNTAHLVRKYVGNWYRTDQRTKARPENMIFTFVGTMLPELIFDNPAVTVSAKRSISHEAIADWMMMAINGWTKEVTARSELEAVALDFLFAFGCMKVGIEPRGDYGGSKSGVMGRFSMDALTPFMVRIPPANVIIDPLAECWQSARFLGHMFQRDLDDLKADDRYDPAIVEQLTADDEPRVGRVQGERNFRDPTMARENRNRVTLYELYFPETRQVGTLSLNASGSGQWIRPLTDYHGPKDGPFVLFGVYTVPDQVYPLSPIAAMAEQDQELNAHAAAAAKEAATAKNLVLVAADQPELAKEIQNAATNSVIKVKGLNGSMVLPVALGGTSEQRTAYLQLLLTRTDRVSGQSEATRGRATGVTATEAQLADANKDARTGFMHLKYRDAVKDVYTRVGWYFFHDPAVVTAVSRTDPASGQQFEGLFLGGPQPGQEDTDWSMFFLDIEPMSMRRVDPAVEQQRALFTLQLVTQIAPLIPQFPYINWAQIIDLIGDAQNMPDFAQTIFNQQGLMLIRAGMQPGMLNGSNPQAAQQLPPGVNPQMQQAAAGVPGGAMMPPMQGGGGGGMMGGGGGGGGGPAQAGVSQYLQMLMNKMDARRTLAGLGYGGDGMQAQGMMAT